MTGSRKSWTTIAGVLLLLAGVVFAALFYGDVALTVVGGTVAVIGLGLLRYGLIRRRRVARG